MPRKKQPSKPGPGRPLAAIDTADVAGALGVKLRAARLAAELTLNELADAIGVPYSTLRNWESGRRLLPIEQARPIAEACGVSVVELIP